VAQAQLELVRIRAVRAELLAELDLTSSDIAGFRLAALDRYERLAHTKRRRASREPRQPKSVSRSRERCGLREGRSRAIDEAVFGRLVTSYAFSVPNDILS
jgi:hypothetical protein